MIQMTQSLNYKRRRMYINWYAHSQRIRRSLKVYLVFIAFLGNIHLSHSSTELLNIYRFFIRFSLVDNNNALLDPNSPFLKRFQT